MKIQWASSFHSDGSPRRPPPSTMHGWLAKMRGTLLGNEDLRSKGMREMRAARDVRKKKREGLQGRSVFGFFSSRKKPSNPSSRTTSRGTRGGHRVQQSKAFSRPSQSRQSSSRSHGAGSRRPSMTPRSSHTGRNGGHSRPQYASRRSTR